MSSLLNERFIAVNPSLVRTFGAVEAIIAQEIHFASLEDHVGGEIGQCTMSQAEIAERVGLSRDQTYRSLKDLIGCGAVVIESIGAAKAKKSYVVDTERVEALCADSRIDPEVVACADSRKHLARQRATTSAPARKIQVHIEEGKKLEEELPPTPFKGEDHKPSPTASETNELFASGRGGDIPTRAEQNRDVGRAAKTMEFDRWWDLYPSGKKGSKSSALKYWLRMGEQQNVTSAEMTERLLNYAAARQMAENFWDHPAPLLNASTFIGGRDVGKHLDYVEPFTVDDERLEIWRYACEKGAANASADEGRSLYAKLAKERAERMGLNV